MTSAGASNDTELGRALAASSIWSGADNPQFMDWVARAFASEDDTRSIWWNNLFSRTGELGLSPELVKSFSASWQDHVLSPAFARAVGNLGRVAPRLSIEGVPDHAPDEIVERVFRLLAQREVYLGALMFPGAYRVQGRCDWHWPIRLVVQGENAEKTDALIEQWKQAAVDSGWLDEIVKLSPVTARTERVDVVFFDGDEAERAMPACVRLRPQFILQRCGGPLPLRQSIRRGEQLVETHEAFGAAILQPEVDAALFLKEFARNLSHDQVVHAAVWCTQERIAMPPPVIVGARWVLDGMCILKLADALLAEGRGTEKPHARYQSVFPSPEGGVGLQTVTFRTERTGLAASIQQRRFTSESEFGVPVIAELDALARVKDIENQESAPRKVQMAVIRSLEPQHLWREQDIAGGEREPRAMPFAAGAANLTRIRISSERLQAWANVEFPENIFSANGGGDIEIRLEIGGAHVVFVPENRTWPHAFDLRPPLSFVEGDLKQDGLQQAAIGWLRLPRVGPSTDANFLIWSPAKPGDELKGTLLLSLDKRMLQALDVVIAVSGIDAGRGVAEAEAAGAPPISLKMRAQPFPEFNGATERREFDLGLFINDGYDGSARLVRIDDAEWGLPLRKVDGLIEKISAIVAKLAYRKNVAVNWDDPEVLEQVRPLAEHGALLRKAMEKLWREERAPARVALHGPWEEYFPIEYLYDGDAPGKFKAPLCPNAKTQFGSGACGACPNRQAGTHVCPLRFWGFSSEIERRYADTLEKAQRPPTPVRRQISAIKPPIVAFSDKAANYRGGAAAMTGLLAALTKATGAAPLKAPDWNQWCVEIALHSPNFLLLLPHTGVWDDLDALQIGKGESDDDWRSPGQLTEAYIGQGSEIEFVVLLGCNTTQSTEKFATFPDQFRVNGADLLLSTIATLRGADAVPIAAELAEMIREANASERQVKTFGAFVTELRRRAFLKGAPGVLGVVGYGDADWVLGKAVV